MKKVVLGIALKFGKNLVRVGVHGILGLGVLIHGFAAHADSGAPQTTAATQPREKKAEFSSSVGGLALGSVVTVNTSPQGGTSEAVTVGGTSAGLKTFAGQKLVLQWDVSGGVKYGQGYSGPFAGAQTDVNLEVGTRLFQIAGSAWSPYVGLGGEFAANPEWSFKQTSLRNSIDNQSGANGSAVSGSGRIVLGISRLDAGHSLLVYSFGQGAYREDGSSGVIDPYEWAFRPDLYLEGGGGVRFDNHNLSAILEVVYGVTPSFNPTGDVNSRLGVRAKFRMRLPRNWAVEAISEVTDTKAAAIEGASSPAIVAGVGQLQVIKAF